MGENKKIDFKTIAIIVMAAVLLICLVKIENIKDQNERMSADISMYRSEINNLRADIAGIYTNVDDLLKREASLFSGTDHSFGDLDAENKTVELKISVIPKIITENMKIHASISDASTELIKNGNAFEGSLELGLFLDDERSPLITIETASGKQTEFLEDINASYLFKYFLSVLDSSMSGSSTYSGGKLNTDMSLSVCHKTVNPDVPFNSCAVVELVDGVEVGREDIAEAVNASDGHYTKEYKKRISLSKEQKFEVYIIAEDSLGYIHKIRAYAWSYGPSDALETYIGDESIYDKDGNMLYGVKYIEVN